MNGWKHFAWALLASPLTLFGGGEMGMQPCPLSAKETLYVTETTAGDKMLAIDGKVIAEGEAPRLSYSGKHVQFLVGGLLPEVRIYAVETRRIESPEEPICPDREAMWANGSLLVWQDGGATHAYDVAKRTRAEFPQLLPDTLAISPDGKTAVRAVADADGTPALELYEIAGGKAVRRIASQSGWRGAASGGAHSPVFSRDGDYLAWVDAGIQPLADIRVMNLKRGEEKAVTIDGRDHQFPAFVPDQSPAELIFSTLGNTATTLQRATLDP